MTMYGAFHPKSDIHRLYLQREKGERGLISCEGCISAEENSLGWYVKNSVEPLLQQVAKTNVIETEGCEAKENFKRKVREDLEKAWTDKRMYGQYKRDLGEEVQVDLVKTWWWLKKGDLKPETEALLCAAQEQALRTNYVKFHIDRTVESPLCRLCGEKGEHVTHLISECKKLAQKEYKRRHDNVARIVHWKLCGLYQLERAGKCYEHQPNGVIGLDEVKILWDFNILCDSLIECRRPDIVVVLKKKKECKIIYIAVPRDSRVGEKELEKMEKYDDLKREIKRMWTMRKIEIIPIVVGALGAVSRNLNNWIEKLDVHIRVELLQNTALLGTARILRN